MTSLKKVFLFMLVVVLLGTTVAFASDGTIVIEDEKPKTNTTNTTNKANTTNKTNSTGNLPQTGENDLIMVVAIGAFAVTAVYAYKKIRDYQNI